MCRIHWPRRSLLPRTTALACGAALVVASTVAAAPSHGAAVRAAADVKRLALFEFVGWQG